MAVIGWIIGGFIAGLVSQWLIKGPRQLGCVGTIVLGIIGSFIGGTVWNSVTGSDFELRTGGFFASVFGALMLLVLAQLFNPRGPR